MRRPPKDSRARAREEKPQLNLIGHWRVRPLGSCWQQAIPRPVDLPAAHAAVAAAPTRAPVRALKQPAWQAEFPPQGPWQTRPTREKPEKKPGRMPRAVKRAKTQARPVNRSPADAPGIGPPTREPAEWPWVPGGAGAGSSEGGGVHAYAYGDVQTVIFFDRNELRETALEDSCRWTEDKGTQTTFDLDAYLELAALHNRIETLADLPTTLASYS